MEMNSFAIFFAIICFTIYCGYTFVAKPRKQNKEQEEQERREQREKDHEIAYKKLIVEKFLPSCFGVEMRDNLEKDYDEIVRLVNLEAIKTAQACVKQDKSNRENFEHLTRFFDHDVNDLKRSWAEMRNNALKLCPNLKDRLPHFSEFEPLKSYNEEHLIQKKVNK